MYYDIVVSIDKLHDKLPGKRLYPERAANCYTCFHPQLSEEYQRFQQIVVADRRAGSSVDGTNPKCRCEKFRFS